MLSILALARAQPLSVGDRCRCAPTAIRRAGAAQPPPRGWRRAPFPRMAMPTPDRAKPLHSARHQRPLSRARSRMMVRRWSFRSERPRRRISNTCKKALHVETSRLPDRHDADRSKQRAGGRTLRSKKAKTRRVPMFAPAARWNNQYNESRPDLLPKRVVATPGIGPPQLVGVEAQRRKCRSARRFGGLPAGLKFSSGVPRCRRRTWHSPNRAPESHVELCDHWAARSFHPIETGSCRGLCALPVAHMRHHRLAQCGGGAVTRATPPRPTRSLCW